MKRIKSYICLTIGILLGLCLVVNAAAQVSTLRGDVNGDGVVNTQDVVYLLRHVLMPEKYPLNQSGDMDVNEQTNLEDVVYLLRHTLKPETYPLECLEHQPQVIPAKAPTCTQTGLTQGECCQNCGKILKEQEVIPVRSHRFEDEWTCHARPCSYADCEHVAPATQAHAFTEWFSVDAGGCVSVSYQIRACMICSETENTIAGGEPIVHGHSYVFLQQTNPTCTEPGCYVLSCENCDLEHRQEFPATGHNLSEYIIDAQGHYKKCLNRNCTYRANQGTHSYDHACDTDCNICGYLRVTYHDWEHTYRSDAHTHWNACSVCGEKKNESAHSGGTATCQQLAKCETCQQPYGEFADHSYTQQNATNTYLKAPATCTDAAVYYFSCECGAKGSLTFSYGDALGHNWEEDYTTSGQKHWIECTACDAIKDEADHSGGTATCQTYAKCETCQQPYGEFADHSYTQQNVTGNYLKTPATCTDAAVYYYSCTCGEKGSQTFSYGDALGHNWDENYTTDTQKHWIECAACDAIKEDANHSGGIATCQEQAECEICLLSYGELADHNYTQQNVMDNYLKAPATCTDAAVYYLSCECGPKAPLTFSYGDALGHNWEEDYTTSGQKHWIECVACDAIKDEADHSGGTATCQQLAKCETCQQPYGEFADHSYTQQNVTSNYLKTPATCTDAAVYYFSCECGDKGVQTFSYGQPLGHNWNEEYATSSQKHWISCNACDAIKDEAAHSGGTATCQHLAECDACQLPYGEYADHSYTKQNITSTYLKMPANCTEAAVYYFSCECGEKGAETFTHGAALGHDWDEAYTTNAQKHWVECSACDAIKDEASHSGGTATCQEQAKCEICLLSYGEFADHSYTQQNVTGNYLKTPATCTNAAVYYYSCACGEKGSQTFSYGDALGHDWDEEYSTDAQKHWIACGTCDAVKDEATHSGGTATCQTYAKCATCGQNYGQLSDHDYLQKRAEQQYLLTAADCTNAAVYYYSCTCGEKGSQTFSYGAPLGHDWAEEYSTDEDNHWIKCSQCAAIKDKAAHSFGAYSQTAAPTCYQEGQEQRSCDTCGLTQSRAIPMTEHVLGAADVITEGPLESEISGEVIYRHVISNPCVNYARCGYYEAVGEVTEHAHQAVTFLPGVDPTCTKTGLTAGAVCGVEGCQEVLVAQTDILALGHDFEDGVCIRCGEQEVVISEGLLYELSADGTYYILAGIGTYEGTKLVIPDSYKALPVKQIKQRAFYNNTTLTEILIPESITSIGNYAFYNATALEKLAFNAVNMADMSSWNYVFYQAGKNSGGVEVTIGKNVQQIPAYLFNPSSNDYVPNIRSVIFEAQSQCIRVGGSAFYCCKANISLSSLTKLKTIESAAFANCTGIVGSVVLPESVDSVGRGAFAGCTKMTELHVPAGTTNLGQPDFSGCTALTAIWVDENNSYYCSDSKGVLYNKDMTSLEAVPKRLSSTYAVADSTTKIAFRAFAECTELTEIYIPKGVKNMDNAFSNAISYGVGLFNGCTGLTAIWVDEENTAYCSDAQGVVYNKDMTTLVIVPPGRGGSFVIPDTVSNLSSGVFNGCTKLEAVSIPASLTYIPSQTFMGCASLAQISLPNTLTSIGDYAFADCTSLKHVDIPEGIKVIWSSVFNGCTSLESVTIPSTVVRIEQGAFYNCTALQNVLIPDKVTSIGSSAFSGCAALESITIPNSVTSIGEAAFMNCSLLKEVTIPGAVTSIGASAFRYCTGVETITISEGVQTVGDYSFNGCTNLKTVYIPVSVTDLGYYAFYDSPALATAYYAGTTAQWNAIDKWLPWAQNSRCKLVCLGDN